MWALNRHGTGRLWVWLGVGWSRDLEAHLALLRCPESPGKVKRGFLGETVWWHSTQPLLHIIAGKVRESASYEAFKTRSVEYTLRLRASGTDRPLASELMEFAPTVELILGREWQHEPQMGADGQLTGLEWAPKEAAPERSKRGPRLRLDVRSAEGIEELVLTLSRPID